MEQKPDVNQIKQNRNRLLLLCRKNKINKYFIGILIGYLYKFIGLTIRLKGDNGVHYVFYAH